MGLRIAGRHPVRARDLPGFQHMTIGFHDLEQKPGLPAKRLPVENPLVASGSSDVVVSNCVLNLVDSRHEGDLFREAFRVLRRGGRTVVSDIVSDEAVPKHLQRDPELWSGCIPSAFRKTTVWRPSRKRAFMASNSESHGSNPGARRTPAHGGGIEFRSVTVVANEVSRAPVSTRSTPSSIAVPCVRWSMTTATCCDGAFGPQSARKRSIFYRVNRTALMSSWFRPASSCRWNRLRLSRVVLERCRATRARPTAGTTEPRPRPALLTARQNRTARGVVE
jgi:hypothetical protein